MKFLYAVLSTLVLGILIGHFFHYNFGNFYEIMLLTLIFLVGIDLGMGTLKEIRSATKKALILPVATITGSLVGGFLTALILSIPVKWALAIAAGCGWYSFAGPFIGQYSVLYGTIAFLANMIREIFMITLYPLGSEKVSKTAMLTLGGASTMDSTLGIVKKYSDRATVVASFVHGFIVTIAVLFLLPAILQGL